VTILTDTGERYLSKVFNDEWMQENQMLEAPRPTVEDLMNKRHRRAPALVSVAPSAQVRQALNLMRTWDVSQIPVIDDGKCLGTLVDGPLMAQAIAQPPLLDRPVREVMEKPLPVVESSLTADRLALMLTRESPAALVQKSGGLIGIVSRMDLLEEMLGTR
jgi:cystathionine beta-synthase